MNKKHSRMARIAPIITAVMVIFIAIMSPLTAKASSGSGHVVVQVIVREFYNAPVTVTLTSTSGSGQQYKYNIGEDDDWFISDRIEPGDYLTSVELYEEPGSDWKGWDMKFAVPYGATTVVPEEKTYITVMEGNKEFTERYWFLCKYERPDGERIRGTVTDAEAEAYFKESIAFESSSAPPSTEEYLAQYTQAQGGATEEEAPEPEKEEEKSEFSPTEKEEKGINPAFIIIPVVIIVLGAIFIIVVRKGRKE